MKTKIAVLSAVVALLFASGARADSSTSTFDFNFNCADQSCSGSGVITATEVPQGAAGWLGWQIDSISGTFDGAAISAIPGESIGDIYQTASNGAYLPTLGFLADGSAYWWEWNSGDVVPYEYVAIEGPQGGFEATTYTLVDPPSSDFHAAPVEEPNEAPMLVLALAALLALTRRRAWKS